jgi:hypothetical protein
VLVRKFKDQLLTRRTNKDQIQVAIKDFEELDSLCQEASTLQHETPKSFLRMAETLTTGKEREEVLDEGLAMKVTPQDVQIARVGNFIIDLRTNAEYVRGHYPNSYNLTKDLHMSTGTRYTKGRGAMERPDWLLHILRQHDQSSLSLRCLF